MTPCKALSVCTDNRRPSSSGRRSIVTLNSFDFTLLGVPFTRGDIFQGGQVIFQDGVPQNVTASFQVFLPPGSPVTNITFGFGEPLGIAYIDLNGDFGGGSFSFQPIQWQQRKALVNGSE